MEMSKRFQGKQAVVTGAATGMGFDIAKRLGMEGATLAILDINQDALAEAAQVLRSDGLIVNAYQLDVSDTTAVSNCFNRLIDDFNGTLDILINNAGIADFGMVETTEFAVWNKVMAVNVNGLILMCQSRTTRHETAR